MKHGTGLTTRRPNPCFTRVQSVAAIIFPSPLLSLGWMRVPGVAGLRLDVSEARARWRAGDADEDVAAGAFDLPARIARIALQRLVAVGTVEFEFGVAHSLHLYMRKAAAKSM